MASKNDDDTTPHLKEIANRIKKLPYRDMKQIGDLLAFQFNSEGLTMCDALLHVADIIEGTN